MLGSEGRLSNTELTDGEQAHKDSTMPPSKHVSADNDNDEG